MTKSRETSPYRLVSQNVEDTDLLKCCVKSRGILKGRLTKLANFISNIQSEQLSTQKRIDLKLRMQGASSLFTEFNDVQTTIEKTVRDCDLDHQLTQRELFEDAYYDALARAEYLLNSAGPSDSSSSCSGKLKSIKLPTISMPTFDGAYEHWIEFRDTFLSLVHNSKDISDIQKFHYLKSSLKGSAELIIEALEFSEINYSVAWELLLNRFNNNRLLVHNHVKALFTLQKLSKESPQLVRKLIDNILKNLRALKILGEPTDSWDTLIIYIITSKLDETTEREWEQFKCNTQKYEDSKPSLKDLLKFLNDRADMLETLQVSHTHNKMYHNNNKIPYASSHNHNKLQCNVSTDNKIQDARQTFKRHCLMCKAYFHPLYTCHKFINSDLDTKLKFIVTNKLCENCLRSGHTIETCMFGTCRKCNKKHNTLIHNDASTTTNDNQTVSLHSVNRHDLDIANVSQASPAAPVIPADTSSVNVPFVQVNSAHIDNLLRDQSMYVRPVLLSTAMIEVADKHNNYHVARALLDSGSQHCFILKSLCDILDANLIQSTFEIRGVGNSITHTTQMCNIDIKSRINNYSTRIKCFVLPNITSTLPAVCENNARFNIPDRMQLADPNYYESRNIDILLGADIFWELLCEGKIRLHNGPFLQNTKLGWIISGPINFNRHSNRYTHCNFTHSIDAQLRRFWELEELPRISDTRTDEERACEDHFTQTTTRNGDGRFCVQIPLKESPSNLGETFPQAVRRFMALENRLQNNPNYKKLYSDFIHEYLDLGHMTRISTYDTQHYFMPHHGVFREHSTTTKLRVVFDASAVSSTGKSFNDLQLVGPPLQSDLVDILLRFRQFRFTACADIEKMYRQCLVNESQRNLQLIVWRDSPSEPLGIYRLNTVTYGTASAPFLSVRCLKQLALDCTDPSIQQIINNDFYVDDLITGSDDKYELLKLCEKTAETLRSGCFKLRKWIFNFECDTSLAPFRDSKELTLGENVQCKTLGLGWHNMSDDFYFNTQFKNDNSKITKRSILSHVSQIFDPLGLLSPTIIIAKVLLQRLWLLQLEWDDEVPCDVMQAWNKFVTGLSALNTVKVPRHVIDVDPIRVELHIFCDASQTAYGTCIYVRTVNNNSSTMVRLLCSKGKVAPLKPVSIPRLELCGALLGARLYDRVRTSLHRSFDSVMFWTDSTIVLGWLRMPPNLLKSFVQNRAAEIHELTKELPWRHVSGKENPADLVSRGVGLEELSRSTLWWEGPDYLRDPNFSCTDVPLAYYTKREELPETKSGVSHSLLAKRVCKCSFFPFDRFSQFRRMRRAVAYIHRFIYNTRNRQSSRSGVLTVEELREADMTLVRLSQLESFPDEFMSLSNTCGTLGNKHNLLKLNLFIDDEKIIRVGGRLGNSDHFTFDKKHPILISSNHIFSILLFRHEHKQLLHAGPQALLSNLRETWWPVGGRNLARKIVHNCVVCSRLRGKTPTPIMGNLPKERITPCFPFFRCGVDYAGPILILNRKGRGSSLIKSYICLFICFVTRAVHLELVSDLTTDAYLLALKRFISRRGKPCEIFSDNGKNFVGLMNDFSKFLTNCSPHILEYATSQNIKFNFIPPYAPHFGGLWEAGVKSCKYHLRRVVGNAHLTYEEFSTVLSQIEAVLNSRPLSPLSTDPHDYTPLTPAHFLVGRPITAPVCADLTDKPTSRLTRYQRVEQIRQHFWSRWAKEYVSELQTRSKWKKDSTELKRDMLVVIKDDNQPPLKWHLGRVINIVPGKDGVTRVADIQTASGIVRRAFTKICPLLDP